MEEKEGYYNYVRKKWVLVLSKKKMVMIIICEKN
jgi:hypothetical protein